jgi:hypothetical protein
VIQSFLSIKLDKKEADPKVKRSASFQIKEGLIKLGDGK